MVIYFAQVERIKPSKLKIFSWIPAFAGMTVANSLMKIKGYVIPAQAGIQSYILK
jgi:hypothetical protein